MPRAVEELQVVKEGNKNNKKDEKDNNTKSEAERFKALDCIMKIMDH